MNSVVPGQKAKCLAEEITDAKARMAGFLPRLVADALAGEACELQPVGHLSRACEAGNGAMVRWDSLCSCAGSAAGVLLQPLAVGGDPRIIFSWHFEPFVPVLKPLESSNLLVVLCVPHGA